MIHPLDLSADCVALAAAQFDRAMSRGTRAEIDSARAELRAAGMAHFSARQAAEAALPPRADLDARRRAEQEYYRQAVRDGRVLPGLVDRLALEERARSTGVPYAECLREWIGGLDPDYRSG